MLRKGRYFGSEDSEIISTCFRILEEEGINTKEKTEVALSPNPAVNVWVSPENRDLDLERISIGVLSENGIEGIRRVLIAGFSKLGFEVKDVRKTSFRSNAFDVKTFSGEIEVNGKIIEITSELRVTDFQWDGEYRTTFRNSDLDMEDRLASVEVDGTEVPVFSPGDVVSIKRLLGEIADIEWKIKGGYHIEDVEQIRDYVVNHGIETDESIFYSVLRDHRSKTIDVGKRLTPQLGPYLELYAGVFNEVKRKFVEYERTRPKGSPIAAFHGYIHGYNVVCNALELLENVEEGDFAGELDTPSIIFGALLHDIGTLEDRERHLEEGKFIARELLSESYPRTETVCKIIEEHDSYSGKEPTSPEAEIVRDADLASFADSDIERHIWANVEILVEHGETPEEYFENTRAMFENLLYSIDPDFVPREELSSRFNRFTGFRYRTPVARRIYEDRLKRNYNIWLNIGREFSNHIAELRDQNGLRYVPVDDYVEKARNYLIE